VIKQQQQQMWSRISKWFVRDHELYRVTGQVDEHFGIQQQQQQQYCLLFPGGPSLSNSNIGHSKHSTVPVKCIEASERRGLDPAAANSCFQCFHGLASRYTRVAVRPEQATDHFE
jgi:hypothetical protein